MGVNSMTRSQAALGESCAVLDADKDGDTQDLNGFRSCHHLAVVGVGGITFSASNYIELEVEESDDDSTWTDAADADVLGSVTGNNTGTFGVIDSADDDDAVYECEYIGTKRYSRVVISFTGTHGTGTPIGCIALKHGHRRSTLT